MMPCCWVNLITIQMVLKLVRKELKMMTSDFIAIVILIFCIVLGLLGILKWLLRFFAGVVLGILILVCIGLLAENPKFNEVSHGAFRDGKVIPYIRNQIGAVGDFIRNTDEEPYKKYAMNK